MVQWLIHLKDGRTIADQYIWEVPKEDITSVERIVNGTVYTICNSPFFENFFVKTTAAKSISLTGGGVQPAKVHERIIGCFVETKDGPIRLELHVDPNNGNCKLTAERVKRVTKDGF